MADEQQEPNILEEFGLVDPPAGNETTTPEAEPGSSETKTAPKEPVPKASIEFTKPKTQDGEGTGDGQPTTEDDPEPSNLDDAQRANWKELRTRREAAEKQAKELESTKLAIEAELASRTKEFEEYKAQYSEDTVKELSTKLTDYEQRLRALSVEDAPEVQAAKQGVDLAKESLTARLKAAAPSLGDAIDGILQLPPAVRDTQIAETLKGSELDQATLTSIYVSMGDLDKATRAVSTAKEQASASANDYVSAQEAKAQAEQEARAKEQNLILGDVLQAASHPETGFAEFRNIDGNEEHNAQVKERLANVRNMIQGDISFQDAAVAAIYAEKGKAAAKQEVAYQETIAQLTAQVDQFKAQIGELTSVEPGGAGTMNDGQGQGDKNDDFVAAVMGDMREAGFTH